jgi:hypothetical protein
MDLWALRESADATSIIAETLFSADGRTDDGQPRQAGFPAKNCTPVLKQRRAARASGALLDKTLSKTLSANVMTGILRERPGWLSDVIWRICTRELAGGPPSRTPAIVWRTKLFRLI